MSKPDAIEAASVVHTPTPEQGNGQGSPVIKEQASIKQLQQGFSTWLASNPDALAAGSLGSDERLETLLEETGSQISTLNETIAVFEEQLAVLADLRLKRQRLLQLQLSLKSLLGLSVERSSAEAPPMGLPSSTPAFGPSRQQSSTGSAGEGPSPFGSFLPEKAFQQAESVLRRKDSVNYEIFRAIVLLGGRAQTKAIREYLIENNVKQPGSGEGFEAVSLSELSARIHYLVRKNLVRSVGTGVFQSQVGWSQEPKATEPTSL